MIAILAGGTGSIKLVRGLAQLEKKEEGISVIANVGDNIRLYGLYVCPDIDTVVYGVAGILDEQRGWGIKGDTFFFLDQLKRSGADAWFALGDRDLATHILRTNMMTVSNGKTKNLTQVTAYFVEKFGIRASVLPATDEDVQTMISTESGEMHLQEYWVKNAGGPRVKGVRYRCIEKARPTRQALAAIKNADKIIIAPGNPVSSIGPTLALKGIRAALSKRRADVIAVSPIIGNAALSGPAVKYMNAIGLKATVAGIAEFYQEVAGSIVIDNRDWESAAMSLKRLGMEMHHTNITMRGRQDEVLLGKYLLQLRKSN